jgi:isoquinoline 1-oxidoreductase
MNTHVKIPPTDLSRRSFLVGSAATGLVLGYAAVPGIHQALAAPARLMASKFISCSSCRR